MVSKTTKLLFWHLISTSIFVYIIFIFSSNNLNILTPSEKRLPLSIFTFIILSRVFALIGIVSYWIDGEKPDSVRKFSELYYEPLEYKILIYSSIITLSSSLIIFLYQPGLLIHNSTNPEQVLISNAQILAGIFAITISLTLLGIEYFSTVLTSRITGPIIKSRFVALVIFSYLSSILLNMFISANAMMISPTTFVIYSNLLLFWCLICMISYLLYIINRLQPTTQVEIVRRNLPPEYSSMLLEKREEGVISIEDTSDMFIDIHRIILRNIEQNNLFIYSKWLSLLLDKQIEYAEYRIEMGERQNLDRREIEQEVNSVCEYFYFIHSNIDNELDIDKNKRFLQTYIYILSSLIKFLVDMRISNALRYPRDRFKDICLEAAKKSDDIGYYLDAADRVFESELENAIEHVDYFDRSFQNASHANFGRRTMHLYLWGLSSKRLFTTRLSFYEQFAELQAESGHQRYANQIQDRLTEAIDDIFHSNIPNNDKKHLINTITDSKIKNMYVRY